MRAIQREGCLAVVKGTRAPLADGVARGAVFFPAARHELAAVDVFVTLEALAWRAEEIGCGFGVCRGLHGTMAADASRVLMSSFEREPCRGVIELPQLFPLPGVVARLTVFFGAMRIVVTVGAGLHGEVILAGSRGDRSH